MRVTSAQSEQDLCHLLQDKLKTLEFINGSNGPGETVRYAGCEAELQTEPCLFLLEYVRWKKIRMTHPFHILHNFTAISFKEIADKAKQKVLLFIYDVLSVSSRNVVRKETK